MVIRIVLGTVVKNIKRTGEKLEKKLENHTII